MFDKVIIFIFIIIISHYIFIVIMVMIKCIKLKKKSEKMNEKIWQIKFVKKIDQHLPKPFKKDKNNYIKGSRLKNKQNKQRFIVNKKLIYLNRLG
jgi:hypothetical protein